LRQEIEEEIYNIESKIFKFNSGKESEFDERPTDMTLHGGYDETQKVINLMRDAMREVEELVEGVGGDSLSYLKNSEE
jgi:hypothetical protein